MTGTKGAVLRAQACFLPEEPCRWVTAPSKGRVDFSSPGRYEQASAGSPVSHRHWEWGVGFSLLTPPRFR